MCLKIQCSAVLFLMALILSSCGSGRDTVQPAVQNAGGSQALAGSPGGQQLLTPELSDSALATPQSTEPSRSIDIPAVLAEIDALAAPADVDKAVFAELKAELARLLGNPESSAGTGNQREVPVISDPDAYDAKGEYLVPVFGQPFPQPYGDGTGLRFTIPGDFDENGIVNIADIVPLARNYGKEAHDNNGYYLNKIDWDNNHIITQADLVGIAVNFGAHVRQLFVYRSMDMQDYPWLSGEYDQIAPAMIVPFSRLLPGDQQNLPSFVYSLPDLQPGEFHWSRLDFSWGLQPAGWLNYRRPSGLIDTDLQLEYADGILHCLQYMPGDFGANSIVELSDISGVSLQYDWARAMQDGGISIPEYMDRNRDGHVGYADSIVCLADLMAYYNLTVYGYYVYVTQDPASIPPAEGASTGNVVKYSFNPEDSREGSGRPARLAFALADQPAGSYIWVENGYVRSEVIQIP